MPDGPKYTATEYLRNREWSLGNGQCPDCCGLDPKPGLWDGRGTVGHTPKCKLANTLRELGSEVVFERPALVATGPCLFVGCDQMMDSEHGSMLCAEHRAHHHGTQEAPYV